MPLIRRIVPMLVLASALGACAGLRGLPPPPPPLAPPALDEGTLRAHLRTAVDDFGTFADALPPPSSRNGVVRVAGAVDIRPDDFDLPIHLNERVEYWANFYRYRIPDRFEQYLSRMGRYQAFILERLRERGMPEDLIFVALIESGFSPVARSPAHAVGLWQFIAPTGRRYGLEVSRYVDQRRDPYLATDAALDYLQDLYHRFGSWYLAAAAYNTGENRVERVLRQHASGRRGDDALFWEIAHALPNETRNYVPKLIAATILGRYAADFGFAAPTHEPDEFDVVEVPDATDLDVIAGAAGVSTAEIERLNPHFIRGLTPPGRATHVRIPAGRAADFYREYALIPPNRRVRVIEHVVASGDTLWGIARRHRVSVAQLQEWNRLGGSSTIRPGDRIRILPGL